MNFLKPKDITIIKDIPPVLTSKDRCGIDTEFFRMTKEKLHRPHGTFACATFCFNDKDVYIVQDPNDLKQAFANVDAAVHIYMNGKFDLTQLRRFVNIPPRKRLWDIMLIEQIMYAGFYNDFSLKDLCRRRLDIYLNKEEQSSFADSDSMSQEQIEYACLDPYATRLVYLSQRTEIDDNDLNIWKNIDLPTLREVLDIHGMKMDISLWKELYEKNMQEIIILQKKYMTNPEILDEMDLKTVLRKKKFQGVSLASWQQVLEECHRLGYKNLKATNEDDLTPYIDKCEFIRDVLDFRGKSKAASTYGMNWIEDGMIEEDGRVYSDFHINGAATGRLSSSSPNLENIPNKDTSAFRECFVADDGYVYVDADWSAQEPRIAAYLSCDEMLRNIFVEKKDVYIASAKLMFDWDLTKSDPRRKKRMKPTVLGASYGLTEYGMEKKYGVPREEGKQLLDTFFDTFEGMANWKKSQQKIKGYVQTIYGRKYWLNPYKQGSENNALNSPVQGSAADVMKIAGHKFMEEVRHAGYEGQIFIVNFVHDELLIECKIELKDWTIETLRKVMISEAEAMHKGIPAEVEVCAGHSWAEAHN